MKFLFRHWLVHWAPSRQ